MGLAGWNNGVWFSSAELGAQLPRDIRTLEVDDFDGLWLSTVRGLVYVDGTRFKNWMSEPDSEIGLVRLDRDDGLDSGQCTRNESGIFKDRHGHIWVGTNRGLSIVNPVEFRNEQKTVTPRMPRIEAVVLDGELVWSPDSNFENSGACSVTIPPGQKQIEIRFVAVDLLSAADCRFRYQLDGCDGGWMDAGSRRSASYSNISPGQYTFRVAVADRNGRWTGKEETLAVIIQPAWWQTWWFRALSFAAFVIAVRCAWEARVQFLHDRNAVQQVFLRRLIDLQEQERERIAKDLHDSLGQNLLVIRGNAHLALRNLECPKEIGSRLRELDAVCGEVIEETRQITRGLRPMQLDHLGLTKAVKSMLRRVEEASPLSINYEIDSLDGLLPPRFEISFYRVIQESLNNVQKHSGATRVDLSMKVRMAKSIHVAIVDNGCGFDSRQVFSSLEDHDGMGLHAIKERVQSMGGRVSCSSKRGGGTRVVFSVPIPSR